MTNLWLSIKLRDYTTFLSQEFRHKCGADMKKLRATTRLDTNKRKRDTAMEHCEIHCLDFCCVKASLPVSRRKPAMENCEIHCFVFCCVKASLLVSWRKQLTLVISVVGLLQP